MSATNSYEAEIENVACELDQLFRQRHTLSEVESILRTLVERHRGPSLRVPEGWALVPWKPTKRMLEVGDSLCSKVGSGPLMKVHYPDGVGPEDVYECMVAAAPSPDATKGSK